MLPMDVGNNKQLKSIMPIRKVKYNVISRDIADICKTTLYTLS